MSNSSFFHRQQAARSPESLQYQVVPVVGVTFDGRQRVIASLKVGQGIRLRREPNNAHDRNAIRVECLDGRQIGYIARDLAARLAPILDETGHQLVGEVTALFGGDLPGSNLGLRIGFHSPRPIGGQLPSVEELDL